jgi:hypothetical protein
MKRFSKKAKAKFGLIAGATAVATTGANAAVLTAEQQQALVTSLSGAYAEYMGLLIAVVTVSAAFFLIARFAKRLGKGTI